MEGEVEVLDSVAKQIAYKVESLKGLLERLKRELSKEKLDRNGIEDILSEIKGLLGSLKILSKRYENGMQSTTFMRFLSLAQQSQRGARPPEELLKELFSIFAVPKLPVDDIEDLSWRISALLTLFTHASEKLSDGYYREKLYEVVPKIKGLADGIAVSIGAELGTLPKLGRLASLTSSWGFGENWAVATAYLQALEVVVNKLMEGLEIEMKEKEKEFKGKFKALIEKLRDKGVELAKLEEQLPPLFWDLRHKVVHAGYEPSEEELNTIVSWTLQILEKLEVLKGEKVVTST